MRLRCCVADRRKETDKANPLLLLMLASLLSKPSIALSILPTTSRERGIGRDDIDPRALEMLVVCIIKSILILLIVLPLWSLYKSRREFIAFLRGLARVEAIIQSVLLLLALSSSRTLVLVVVGRA